MKTLKSIVLFSFILAIMFGFSACTNSDTTTAPKSDIYSASELVLPATTNAQSNIADASLSSEMMLQPPMDGYLLCPPNDGGTPPDPGRGGMMPDRCLGEFARIFRAMKVTPDELTAIKPLMESYRNCVKDAMLKLRESEKAIIQAANDQRKLILAGVKDSTISRADAKAQLIELNKNTRQLLQDNPMRTITGDAMKCCKKTLLDAIRLTLTTDQQLLWDEWLAKMPKIDCPIVTSP